MSIHLTILPCLQAHTDRSTNTCTQTCTCIQVCLCVNTLERFWKNTEEKKKKNQPRTETSCVYLLHARLLRVCVGVLVPLGWAHTAEDAAGSMSSDREEYDMVCQKAVTLIVDLCLHNSTLLDQDTCQDFLFLLSSQSSDHKDQGKYYN